MKSYVWLFITLFISLILMNITACEQKKGTPPPQPEIAQPGLSPGELPSADLPPNTNPPLHPPEGAVAQKSIKPVTVPDSVKGQWESVILRIEDKTSQTSSEQTIALGSDYRIPDSNITIKTGEFLPQFTMDQDSITSLSNETQNPALKVTVIKEGEEVFKGWLFERFPDMHPFQDDRYGISLVGYHAKTPSESVEEKSEKAAE